MSLGLQNLPGADVLRLLRCFRVFRLFKRIPSLRQIIVALSASVPPMINAFALVCLVTAIYAIMSVTFFSTKAPEQFGDFFTVSISECPPTTFSPALDSRSRSLTPFLPFSFTTGNVYNVSGAFRAHELYVFMCIEHTAPRLVAASLCVA